MYLRWRRLSRDDHLHHADLYHCLCCCVTASVQNESRPTKGNQALAQRLAAFESEIDDELTVLSSSAKEILRALEGLAPGG